MKSINVLMLCSSMTLAGSAFADSSWDTAERSNLESLKAKCAELSSNQQLKPLKVQVTCRESGFYWKQAETSAQLQLTGHRELGAAVHMKNFEVPFEGAAVVALTLTATCPIFEKVRYQIAGVDVQLSCEDLNQVESLAAYCTPIIDERRAADPSVVQEEATSETLNPCLKASSTVRN